MKISPMNGLMTSLAAGLLLLISCQCAAEVVPAKYYADGMIIQRDELVAVWGTADPGEKVKVYFLGKPWKTRADKKGRWELELPAQPAGRGLQMTIGKHVIRDIAFGDVWLASGQSNMSFKLHQVRFRFPEELELAAYPDIRQFLVQNDVNFKGPQQEFSAAQWHSASRQSVGDFSAVAWFFAKQLSATQGVAIGIINASVGATPVESWMSYRSLDDFPAIQSVATNFANDAVINTLKETEARKTAEWSLEARRKDAGLSADSAWSSPGLDDGNWKSFAIPGTLNKNTTGFNSGVVWLRREILLTEAQAAVDQAKLQLGLLVDSDETFINGHLVGSTPTRYIPRKYEVPAGVLRPGRNVISIRLQVKRSWGGAIKGEIYQLAMGQDVLDLEGIWKQNIGARMPSHHRPERLETKPTGLYNAMIAPAHKIKIKGFIWYQGESNTDRPHEYSRPFSNMITDWRKQWGQGDLPFLFVQLANYMKPSAQPEEASWADLRQAQAEVEAMLPNAAMALAIDVGERHNIHPLDKKTVGQRLALGARALAYNEESLVYQSPKAAAVTRDGNRLVVSFDRMGGGLTVDGEVLQGFAVAGRDGIYMWAKAKLDGNQVVVWNDELSEPVHVRYAWAQNPEDANLYSVSGLPTVPFSMKVSEHK